MQYTTLGASGLVVSRLVLGMMSYGDHSRRAWHLDLDEARPIVRRAVEAGVTVFDTADVYDRGVSEELTGTLLRELFGSRELLTSAAAGEFTDREIASLHRPPDDRVWGDADLALRADFNFADQLVDTNELVSGRLDVTQNRITQLGTTASDLRLERGRPVAVETDRGPVDADVVVCAISPRGLPTLAPHVARTMPAIPPVVCHLGLAGQVPALPHEVVLHGDPTLVVRTNGTAPEGRSAWTVLARGRLSEDVVLALSRLGIDVRDRVQVRIDRSPRTQVEELAGSAYGVLWEGRATIDRKLVSTPYDGVFAVGAHVAAGAALPFVGLSAAVVADQIGAVPRTARG